MKFTGTLHAVAVSAAKIVQRSVDPVKINIITISGSPDGTGITWNFTVKSQSAVRADTCGATTPGNKVTEVHEGRCSNPAWTWGVNATTARPGGFHGGFWFYIGFPFNARLNQTYCAYLAADDFHYEDGPSSLQYYSGIPRFNASVDMCFSTPQPCPDAPATQSPLMA